MSAMNIPIAPEYRARVIDSVVCDVGNVVILFEPQVSGSIEDRFGLPKGRISEVLLKSPATKMATIGSIDYPEWLRRVSIAIPPEAVRAWLEYHGEKNLPLIQDLVSIRRGGIFLALLSNATRRLWDDLAYHGLNDLADAVFCSADIGYAKPDARAYTHVAEATSIELSRTFYIDDTPSWVEAGRALGMRGHVYRTPEALTSALLENEVLR